MKGKSQGKIPSRMNGFVLPEFINYCAIFVARKYRSDSASRVSRIHTTGASRASRSTRFSKWRQPQTRLIISLLCIVSSLNLDCFELRFIISILIPIVDTFVSLSILQKPCFVTSYQHLLFCCKINIFYLLKMVKI